jgi:hypothetical protein
MKPINEMSLAECLADIRKGNYLGRYELADRIHDLTRWIPVSERLPDMEDGEIFTGKVMWTNKYGYVGQKTGNKLVELVTHWRHIDKPEGV